MYGVGLVNIDKNVFAKIKTDKELYSEDVMRLLNTSPGERVNEPDYGCSLKKLVFEPNDYYLQRVAIYLIQQAFVNFEPRLEIVAIDITTNNNEKKLRINLFLKVKQTQENISVATDIKLVY